MTSSSAVADRFRIGRDLYLDRDVDVRHIARVAPVNGEAAGLLVVARQEQDRAASGQLQCERRAPRAGTNDCPMRVSIQGQDRFAGDAERDRDL